MNNAFQREKFNTFQISRASTVTGAPPTAAEAPDSLDGDTAIVFLTVGVEHYKLKLGTWVLEHTQIYDTVNEYIGAQDTLAALPTTRTDGSALVPGDRAILKKKDGLNEPGMYFTDGTTWSLKYEVTGMHVLPLVNLLDRVSTEESLITGARLHGYMETRVKGKKHISSNSVDALDMANENYSGNFAGSGLVNGPLGITTATGFYFKAGTDIVFVFESSSDETKVKKGSTWLIKAVGAVIGDWRETTLVPKPSLRLDPVSNSAAMILIQAKNFSIIKTLDTNGEYIFTTAPTPEELANSLNKAGIGGLWVLDSVKTNLRGAIVADEAELKTKSANDFEKRKVRDTGKIYVFTTSPTTDQASDSNNIADTAGTGYWILTQGMEINYVNITYATPSNGDAKIKAYEAFYIVRTVNNVPIGKKIAVDAMVDCDVIITGRDEFRVMVLGNSPTISFKLVDAEVAPTLVVRGSHTLTTPFAMDINVTHVETVPIPLTSATKVDVVIMETGSLKQHVIHIDLTHSTMNNNKATMSFEGKYGSAYITNTSASDFDVSVKTNITGSNKAIALMKVIVYGIEERILLPKLVDYSIKKTLSVTKPGSIILPVLLDVFEKFPVMFGIDTGVDKQARIDSTTDCVANIIDNNKLEVIATGPNPAIVLAEEPLMVRQTWVVERSKTYDPEFLLSTSYKSITIPEDLSKYDQLAVWIRGNSGRQLKASGLVNKLNLPATKVLSASYDTQHLTTYLTDFTSTSFTLKLALPGQGGSLIRWELLKLATRSVTPKTLPIATKYPLTITGINGYTVAVGDDSLGIYDAFFSEKTMTIPAGNKLRVEDTTDCAVSLVNDNTFRVKATGAAPSVVFKLEAMSVGLPGLDMTVNGFDRVVDYVWSAVGTSIVINTGDCLYRVKDQDHADAVAIIVVQKLMAYLGGTENDTYYDMLGYHLFNAYRTAAGKVALPENAYIDIDATGTEQFIIPVATDGSDIYLISVRLHKGTGEEYARGLSVTTTRDNLGVFSSGYSLGNSGNTNKIRTSKGPAPFSTTGMNAGKAILLCQPVSLSLNYSTQAAAPPPVTINPATGLTLTETGGVITANWTKSNSVIRTRSKIVVKDTASNTVVITDSVTAETYATTVLSPGAYSISVTETNDTVDSTQVISNLTITAAVGAVTISATTSVTSLNQTELQAEYDAAPGAVGQDTVPQEVVDYFTANPIAGQYALYLGHNVWWFSTDGITGWTAFGSNKSTFSSSVKAIATMKA